MTVDLVPIVLKIAHRIAHRMSVFAGQYGAGIACIGNIEQSLPPCILSTFAVGALRYAGIEIFLAHPWIEATDDINGLRVVKVGVMALRSFVVNGACGVELMEPSCHGSMVGTIATLVAQAPKDNRRTVFIALRHADATVEKGGCPVGSTCQGASQSVTLTVSLVHHKHADRVAQLIPTRTIGIMRQAHGIDVGLLHQQEVFDHQLFTHHTSCMGVVFVAIHTTQFYHMTVDKHLAALDFYLSETHTLLHLLCHTSVGAQ